MIFVKADLKAFRYNFYINYYNYTSLHDVMSWCIIFLYDIIDVMCKEDI